jgi:Cobalamin biosynthesis protein CobT (nicotinate-mononucleotide:5, 6-dimethylbenzimidazole phosphoribosyltransferase)
MKRFLSLICVFLLIFAVVSCGGKKKNEEKPAYEEQVTQEISAEEGGTVKNSDESVSIEVPGGALDENLTITMTIYDAQDYVGTEGQKVVSKVVEFEPSGTVFKKPVIIRMAATEPFENQVVTAAVYRESKGEWSYSEHGTYAVLQGRDAAGDPIMTTAAGDPIMLSAAGDPIMMDADGNSSSLCAAGDPIMLASAGDPIMTNAAGDPIMTSAAGDPIMMTTGHFTAYTFITLDTGKPVEPNDNDDTDDTEEPVDDGDSEPVETDDGDSEPAETDDDEPVAEEDDDEPIDDTDVPEPVDDDMTPVEPGIYSKVLCTGQIHCSDGNGSIIDCPAPGEYLYGQNGSYAGRKSCVPHKYTKIVPADEESPEGGEPTGGDQTPSYIQVVDESTGLRWALVYGSATWERAKTACENLEYGGFEDWRLPSAKEWLSIADHDRLSPALRYFHFSKLEGSGYWTMTPVAENEDRYLIFGTDNATLSYDNASYAHYFVCVRGDEYGKAVEGSFSVLTQDGDEIVKDSATNLVWQKNYTAELNWKEALAYCANLNYAGYTDWRLPNKNELLSLVDYEKTTKPISMFPGDEGDYFWTSTFGYYYGGPDGALTINTEDGEISTSDADEDGPFVRCVRSDTEPDTGIPLCDESRSAPCEDASTHYVWSQVDFFMTEISWKDKAVQCRESKSGGISQWRIPTIDEIRTILTASDKLKTGGECPVTDACSYFSAGCFDEEYEGKCTEEEGNGGFESSLYDYGYYVLSGTISDESDGVYYAWAVDLTNGSLSERASTSSDDYSVSRCIKDDSLPNPEFPYTDSASGLVWSERSPYDLSWYEAAAYCQDLVEGGSNNWRVPTMEEVKTLVKNCPEGDCKPDTAGKYSALGELSTLWTSTVLTYESTSYFSGLDFMTASQKSWDSEYDDEKVRCVRSASDPANVSEIHFPFEIYDLLWSKASDYTTYYASDSQAYCDSLSAENYGGKNNWRVPEKSEVALLIRKSVCLNKDDFVTNQSSNGRCSGYSFDGYSILGDMFILKSSGDYYFDFARGQMSRYNYGYVRCVADL